MILGFSDVVPNAFFILVHASSRARVLGLPRVVYVGVAFLVPAVPVVFLIAPLLLLIVSVFLEASVVSVVFVFFSLRLKLFPIEHESSFRPVLVVEVGETLVVDAKLEHIPMLHDVQHVVVDLKGVLERCAEFLDLEYHLSVSEDLLFPT